jgi:magnesium-transporting ATPase (P-type)
VKTLEATIECEFPNDKIYKYEGIFKSPKLLQDIPLSPENLLLRGSSLRNTEFIYGVVVFVGHDSKIMLNTMSQRNKVPRNERTMNKLIICFFIIQSLICFICALYSTLWSRD